MKPGKSAVVVRAGPYQYDECGRSELMQSGAHITLEFCLLCAMKCT